MNYIILDIQANEIRPSMYKDKKMPDLNDLLHAEIVRICVMKLDENFKEVDKYINYIKPQLYDINPTVLIKLGITETEINNGDSFINAIKSLKEFMGEDYLIVVNSMNPILDIRRNCLYYNIDSLWLGNYIDIQYEMGIILGLDRGKQIGLESSIDYFNIKHIYEIRKGLSNVYYASKLLQNIVIQDNFKGFMLFDSNELKTAIKSTIKCISSKQGIQFEHEISYTNNGEYKWKFKCPNCGNDFKEYLYVRKQENKYKFIGICNICNSKVYHRTRIKMDDIGETRFHISDVVLTEEEYQDLIEWKKWD